MVDMRDIPDAEIAPVGIDEAKEAVRNFLNKQVRRSTEIAASSVKLTLQQTRNGGQRHVANFTYTFTDVGTQADEVVQAAEEDLDTHRLTGRTRYRLMAQVGAKQPVVIFMLYVPTTSDGIDDAFENNDNVDPSVLGREAMNQRHTEAFARIIAVQARSGEKLVAHLLDRANEKIERLEARIEEYRAREDDMQSREFARRIVLEDRRIQQEEREQKLKVLLGVGVGVGSKALGVPPEALMAMLAPKDAARAAEDPTRNSRVKKDASDPTSTGPTEAERDRFYAIGEALFGSIDQDQQKLIQLAGLSVLSDDEKRAIFAMYEIVGGVRKRQRAAESTANESSARKSNGRRAADVRYEPYDPYSASAEKR